MIVCKLDVDWTFPGPGEANTELVVHANRMLPNPISLQGLQPISRWDAEIVQRNRGIQILQFAPRDPEQIRRETLRGKTFEGRLSS
jgi:hypothetical protein